MSTYLGQNFLKDSKVISYITTTITALIKEHHCDTLIEIGPGKGAITKKIAQLVPNFYVIERDNNMIPYIKDLGENIKTKVNIIHMDILEVNVDKVLAKSGINPAKTLIVGNLPYYITSPIIRKFFGGAIAKYGAGFFMIQKEVGDKIKFDAPKKSFLRWMSNFAHHVKYSKTVSAKSFNPAPKVQSCLVTFTPKPEPEFDAQSFEALFTLLDTISPYKRKTLGKIRKMLAKSKHKIKAPSPDTPLPEPLKSLRLEELTRDQMGSILAAQSAQSD